MSYHAIGCDCMDCHYLRGGESAQSELLSSIIEKIYKAKDMCKPTNQARLDTVVGILRKVIEEEK